MKDNVIEFFDRELIEAQAREWLIRLDGDGPLKPEDRAALQHWAGQSATHRQELLRIAAFWSEADLLAALATPQRRPRARWQAGLTRMWSVLCTVPRASVATILVLIVAGILLVPVLSGPGIESSNGHYATRIGERRGQVLSDGSVVDLNTDSEVEVAYSQDSRLVRLLKGEAHFKVAHDRSRPFDVYTGRSFIRATGTAFSVHVEGEKVTVTVAEGSVALGTVQSIALEPPVPTRDAARPAVATRVPPGAALRPIQSGEVAVLHDNAVEIHALDADHLAQQLAWREGFLVFTGEPLSHVVDEMSRYTPVRIEITDARLRTLPVGGRFKLGNLDAMLDVLESNFGIQVLWVDAEHVRLGAPGRI